MASESTPAQKARQAEEEFTRRFTAAEISSMSMSEFAALTGRTLVTGPAAPGRVPDGVPEPTSEPVPNRVSEARGIDVSEMTPAEYKSVRGQLGMGVSREYGVGILDGTAPGAWAAAAKAKAGRSALVTKNTVESPRLTGRTVLRQDTYRDTRTVAERFSNPANVWQG